MNPAASPRLAVIIPALNEASALPSLLNDLGGLVVTHEILVADGGSSDGTDRIAEELGARVIRGYRGRGAQMGAAARETQAQVLCFLHAVVRLDRRAVQALERVASQPMEAAWAYRLCVAGRGFGYRLIELGANLRSSILRLPYGDQGLIVSRDVYLHAGGFLPLPLMEDVSLVRAVAQHVPVRLLGESACVSARRWEREGIVRRTAMNWVLLGAWMLGAPPERLARWYRHAG